MPPEFPGERQKRRETPPPKESRSVGDLAKDIKREYRELQIKNLNDEKAVGQQGEGQFSPKAPAESMSEAIGNKFRGRTEKEHRERIGPEVHMRFPEVRGEEVTTKEQLRSLTDEEYSALKKKKDFPKRMREAEAHLDLMKKYEGIERVKYGDMEANARKLDCDPETISNWLTTGMTPRLYTYMNWSTPRSEAAEKVRHLQEANNGIRNAQDVQKRLDTYYFGNAEREARFYVRELKKMDKYFEFLELYKQGGMHLDTVKEARLSESGAREYLDGGKPWLVRLAVQIPAEQPLEGYKWLPKSAGTNAHRDDWIPVPEKISGYQQVIDVVRQLKALDNEDMKRWDKKYGGDYSLEESFMHLLGTCVSDSSVPSSSRSSISFGINLSKGYDWSKDYGEASCYNLGRIGIKAHRVADVLPYTSTIMTPHGERKIVGKEQYQWMSENSPVLRWIRRTCLGYNDSPKTYQEVNANWILAAPENLRRAFLQGYSDGDGGASTRGYYFSISTHSNHGLVARLLESFGVDTYRSKTFVRTADSHAVREVSKIPPFKYARGRQETLEKAARMIESRINSWKSNPPSRTEVDFMIVLRRKGMSYGEIGEKTFDRFGYSLDARDIRRIIRKYEKT